MILLKKSKAQVNSNPQLIYFEKTNQMTSPRWLYALIPIFGLFRVFLVCDLKSWWTYVMQVYDLPVLNRCLNREDPIKTPILIEILLV